MHSLFVSFLEPSRDERASSQNGGNGPTQATASPSLRVAIQLAQEENGAESKGVDKEDDSFNRDDYGHGN